MYTENVQKLQQQKWFYIDIWNGLILFCFVSKIRLQMHDFGTDKTKQNKTK